MARAKVGRLAGILILLALPCSSFGVGHQLWIFDQLSTAPVTLINRQVGYELGVSAANYVDTVSLQASLYWMAKDFEFGVKGAGRVFPDWSDTGKETETAFDSSQQNYGVEIARRFVSADGRYGRLGLEFDQFLPGANRFLQVGIDTGILDNTDFPWLLRIRAHFFVPLTQQLNSRIVAGLEGGYRFKTYDQATLRGGIGLLWTYRSRTELNLTDLSPYPNGVFESEHMLFSFTPWIEYSTQSVQFRLSAPLRIWLNKEWSNSSGKVATPDANPDADTQYPNTLGTPDFYLSATWLL